MGSGSLRFSCPRCGEVLTAPEAIGGSKAKCPNCGTLLVLPSALSGPDELARQINPHLVALDELAEATRHDPSRLSARPRIKPSRPNWLARHKNRCGARSFIFQCALLGWTAFMLFVGLGLMIATLPTTQEQRLAEWGAPQGEGAVLGWGLWGLCCPIGTWLLLALPLGIAAIATIGSYKKK